MFLPRPFICRVSVVLPLNIFRTFKPMLAMALLEFELGRSETPSVKVTGTVRFREVSRPVDLGELCLAVVIDGHGRR